MLDNITRYKESNNTFLSAAILCSAVKYLTGYAMEKLFHAKWWNYSHMPFQIHGRICLYRTFLFGVSNVFICKWIQPSLLDLSYRLDLIYLQ